MDFDDLAWERSDGQFDLWKKQKLLKWENLIAAGNLIDKWRGGVPDTLLTPGRGAFNAWIRLTFLDGGSAVMRIPCYGRSMFREEKVQRELSVMRFLERHTNIAVPHILHYGMTKECPDELGPFIIMEYIEHDHDLVDALNTPGIPDDERPILDPNVSEERLVFAYGQMADIMLQLSKHTFSDIGCIGRKDEKDDFDDIWTVMYRPLTLNMNELVQVGNFPPHLLPNSPFKTSYSYFIALADMHMAHLETQRNDAIESSEDCRRKYIARCLFRKLAREGRFCKYNDRGPFKLFCDDFRPANVLTNADFKVTGAIDWEFTYSAPLEFVYSPPFWLLLEIPEYWPGGLDDWIGIYEKRLQMFLAALEEREIEAIDRGQLKQGQSLSMHMKESWESGDCWISYAARRSWAFDMIYWAKIDRRFFGDGDIHDRFKLLTQKEQQDIDGFVQKKIEEKEERTLADWSSWRSAIE
jgi:hypothetical protein